MKEKLAQLLILIPTILFAQTYVYETTKSGKSWKTTWEIDETGDTYVLNGKNKEDSTKVVYTKNFETIELVKKDLKDSSGFEMKRDGNTLYGKKIGSDWEINKEFRLGNQPWIQNFAFGFRPFIQSNRRSKEFSILNPKNFKMHKLIVKRGRKMPLTIGEKTYQARKMEITLPGFEGMFWSAYIWIDLETLDMVKYQGDEGPGTATSTTLLISKE